MASRAAFLQLARLLGKDEFYRRLGLDESWQAGELSAEQLEEVHALVEKGVEELGRALAEEAAANDDVFDAGSAVAYLEDRLVFFGELLTAGQREAIRACFREVASQWG